VAIGFYDKLNIIRPGLQGCGPGMALAMLIASAICVSIHERVQRVAEVRGFEQP
jgi:hypothetical protein